MESLAMGKYNTGTLIVLLLDKKTREVQHEQKINLASKSLKSYCSHKDGHNTVYNLNKFGFWEYVGSNYIVRYELVK